MKIAITGHTAGIGKALAEAYHGHDIVGLSKRDGNNIRNIPKIADQIEPCDMFINNAQDGYAQTELLFEISKRWTNTNKHIIVISTIMTQQPISVFDDLGMDQYRIQKVALEEAVKQIRNRQLGVKITIVRPGMVGTSAERPVPPAADPGQWARTLIGIFNMAHANGLAVPDISLGPV